MRDIIVNDNEQVWQFGDPGRAMSGGKMFTRMPLLRLASSPHDNNTACLDLHRSKRVTKTISHSSRPHRLPVLSDWHVNPSRFRGRMLINQGSEPGRYPLVIVHNMVKSPPALWFTRRGGNFQEEPSIRRVRSSLDQRSCVQRMGGWSDREVNLCKCQDKKKLAGGSTQTKE